MKGKKGISLITLVITIIVIIILVAAVILALNATGILTNASLAKYEQDRDAMQSILEMAVQKAVLRHQGSIGMVSGKVNEPTMNEKEVVGEIEWSGKDLLGLKGKIIFDEGTDTYNEFYTGEKLPVYGSETTWYLDDNGKLVLKVGDRIIGGELPKEIGDYIDYGVDINGNGITTDDWILFYKDGVHRYIIAADYVSKDKVPKGRKETEMTANTEYKLSFNEVYKDYQGAEDIKGAGRSWLDYLNTYGSSANVNMRAVAYLLDTDVWNKTEFYTDKAEYVIGGPTLDMFVLSYNKMHKDKPIEYSVTNTNGYRVKWKTDVEYSTYITGLDKSQPWVITSNEKANAMWLASPSAFSSYYVMFVYVGGTLNNGILTDNHYGVRPVVCLKSGL